MTHFFQKKMYTFLYIQHNFSKNTHYFAHLVYILFYRIYTILYVQHIHFSNIVQIFFLKIMYISMCIQYAKHFKKWTQFCKFNIHIFFKECTQFCTFYLHNFLMNLHNFVYLTYTIFHRMNSIPYCKDRIWVRPKIRLYFSPISLNNEFIERG